MSFMQALNWGVQGVLGVYSEHALHRQSDPFSDPLLDESTMVQELHFFRAMCRFEPAIPHLNELIRNNLRPRVFRLQGDEENYHLHQWPLTAIRAIEYFSRNPAAVGANAVFAGHSAGGLPVYILAAIANGVELGAIREALTNTEVAASLDEITSAQYQQLARALSQALFVSIGTPYLGIQLTPFGRCLNRYVVEPRNPLLINSLRTAFLENIYQTIGLHPSEVIHGQMISNAAPLQLSRHPLSLPVEVLMQGGMRLVALITEYEIYDGIAPLSATYVEGIPEREIVSIDHLRLVETAESAKHLVALITRTKRLL